jgi:hypothetical protein
MLYRIDGLYERWHSAPAGLTQVIVCYNRAPSTAALRQPDRAAS